MEAPAKAAADTGAPLPPEYHRMFRWWFVLGWPGFGGVVAIFALMLGGRRSVECRGNFTAIAEFPVY